MKSRELFERVLDVLAPARIFIGVCVGIVVVTIGTVWLVFLITDDVYESDVHERAMEKIKRDTPRWTVTYTNPHSGKVVEIEAWKVKRSDAHDEIQVWWTDDGVDKYTAFNNAHVVTEKILVDPEEGEEELEKAKKEIKAEDAEKEEQEE